MNWLKTTKKIVITSIVIVSSMSCFSVHAGGHGWGHGGGHGWGHGRHYERHRGHDCGHRGYQREYYQPRFFNNHYYQHQGYAYNQPIMVIPPSIPRPYNHNYHYGNQGRLGVFFEKGF